MLETNHIQVIGSARMIRTVEVHRGAIELTMSTKRGKQTSVNTGLKIRDEVIEALIKAGIPQAQIHDSGGSTGRSYFGTGNDFRHQLRIEHADLSVVNGAMTTVETVFTGKKSGLFANLSHHFRFEILEPRFTNEEKSYDKALREAMADARRKAQLLAEEGGLKLGPISQITEIVRKPERPARWDEFSLDAGDDAFGYSAGIGEDMLSEPEPAPINPKEHSRRVAVKVRYLVTPS